MAEDFSTIVIDNGSGSIKAGFGGYKNPTKVIPTIVGRPLTKKCSKNFFIGEEARAKSFLLKLENPIKHGIISNWDDMEKIWHHTFYNELRIDPTEHAVLLTEPVQNPIANREKTIQMMFETFNVPYFYLFQQSVGSLYATGRTTGIVLDIGEEALQITPVNEGYLETHGISRFNIGGGDLTKYMIHVLRDMGMELNTLSNEEISKDIKEKLCYVALDYEAEKEKAKTSGDIKRSYALPNGNNITINTERFQIPELLFNPFDQYVSTPFYVNTIEDGIDKILYDSIMKTNDKDQQKDYFSNIILSGGSTMFEGLAERLEKEITKLAPDNYSVIVIASPERPYLAWVGGSILATLTPFPQMVITKEEYEEVGPIIVHRKCF